MLIGCTKSRVPVLQNMRTGSIIHTIIMSYLFNKTQNMCSELPVLQNMRNCVYQFYKMGSPCAGYTNECTRSTKYLFRFYKTRVTVPAPKQSCSVIFLFLESIFYHPPLALQTCIHGSLVIGSANSMCFNLIGSIQNIGYLALYKSGLELRPGMQGISPELVPRIPGTGLSNSIPGGDECYPRLCQIDSKNACLTR